MNIDDLLSTYARLRTELSDAYVAPAWRASRIDRLVEELSEVERKIAECQPLDEQTSDAFPVFAFGR
jgi:hypothetical protein